MLYILDEFTASLAWQKLLSQVAHTRSLLTRNHPISTRFWRPDWEAVNSPQIYALLQKLAPQHVADNFLGLET